MATYNIRTSSIQDWRDTMMSKAEFNAMAAERRANRAGSGFDEFGKHYALGYSAAINEGMHTNSAIPYSIYLGRRDSDGIGTSKTYYPSSNINGVIQRLDFIGANTAGLSSSIILPPAPTVLPHTATLTQEQIDSGVIKHADASNSGLIVNGKFDTDTSGWVKGGSPTVTIGAYGLTLTNTLAEYGALMQSITNLVIGKKYTVEVVLKGSVGSFWLLVANAGLPSNVLFAGNATTDGRQEFTFTPTATNCTISFQLANVINNSASIDNVAVFPADAISRSDLTFLESWHEDVSEKDFVYPLGNVQYLATTGDAGTAAVGAFAGASTYSLFSDTWQADSALVGRGYVWSTLSDANKRAFVANPENNCYLDGDKVIQVRYRVRVVMGWGDSWANADVQAPPLQMLGYQTDASALVLPKGKKVSNVYDIGTYTDSVFYAADHPSKLASDGIFGAGLSSAPVSAVAYEGKCYALPIALVHRRNQGGYNLTYNPHGTKTMTMTPTSIADCFTEANYTAATGYIGTSTSRPDGLFYDQVSIEDFKPSNKGADLRNTSKKRNAQNIIEEFAPKVIAGTIPYYNNDTTALTTYKDTMEVRDTSGNRYGMVSKVGNVVTIGTAVANKKGFSVVTLNGKQYLQVADDAVSDTTVQMNLSTIKYDIGVFDA